MLRKASKRSRTPRAGKHGVDCAFAQPKGRGSREMVSQLSYGKRRPTPLSTNIASPSLSSSRIAEKLNLKPGRKPKTMFQAYLG